jgi:hypothetical protein
VVLFTCLWASSTPSAIRPWVFCTRELSLHTKKFFCLNRDSWQFCGSATDLTLFNKTKKLCSSRNFQLKSGKNPFFS